MEKSRTLLTYHDLTVEVESSPGEELIEHMSGTILGMPGGFRYQHTDIVDRLSNLGENYFMFLRKNGKMLGSVGFCGRHTSTTGLAHDSWLIRYFSIKAPMRTVPSRKKEKEDLEASSRRSTVLGRFLQPIFADPSRLRVDPEGDALPSVIYALIDQKNLRSLNFSAQLGLEKVGEVANFSFSRMNPRNSERVGQLPLEDREHMMSLLVDFYRDYTLFVPDPIFKDNLYYVIREAGQIVAGVQVYHITWRIIDFGSGPANRVIRMITGIPWVRRRLNPDALRLLAFDAIYCEPGHERDLYELLEGVLERTGVYVGMLMMDTGSGLYRIFSRNKKFGVLHRLLGTFVSEVRARFINFPEEVRNHYLEHPTYIPTYDNS